jgi:hypothetical protein
MNPVNSINNNNYNNIDNDYDNIPNNTSTMTNNFLASQIDFAYLDILSDLLAKMQFLRIIEEIEAKCFLSSHKSDLNNCQRFLELYKIVSECINNCSIMKFLCQKVLCENILNMIQILYQRHDFSERFREN